MRVPLDEALADSSRVLIAGAGGGFDIVSGIPLCLSLLAQGKEVVLGNLSFTSLLFSGCPEICFGTYQVTGKLRDLPYFPEKYLLEWLQLRGLSPALYCFSNKLGVQLLRNAYAQVIDRHEIDTLVVVDGGTDSLIFGDEPGIGTIVEDACSILAAVGTSPQKKYLLAIGFGIDHFHDVNHHACLENIATLIRDGGYLGAFSLCQESAEGQAYLDLVDYLNRHMDAHKSIVANSVAAAVRGEFGDVHLTDRTRDSELFINPLMSLFWAFKLDAVARRMQFAADVETADSMTDVARRINAFRDQITPRERKAIPL